MPYRLRLDTKICPDLEHLMHPTPAGSMEPAIRYRSKPSQRLVREFSKLENPIVVRFINATTEQKLFVFLKAFGLPSPKPDHYDPHGEAPANLETLPHIAEGQRIFRRLLEMAGSGDAAKAIDALNRLTFKVHPMLEDSKGKPRLIFSADNLRDFMQMEVLMVAESGAHLGKCEWCGDLFLTGKGTRGRSTKDYCQTKHRVYADRDRKRKAKGGQDVS